MATKHSKYGKSYDTPLGLQEDNYYEMMYDLMDYANRNGLTTRQAQKLFVDCADMILDCNISLEQKANKLSNIDRLINKLDDIKVRLEDIPQYKNIYVTDNPQC